MFAYIIKKRKYIIDSIVYNVNLINKISLSSSQFKLVKPAGISVIYTLSQSLFFSIIPK